MLRCWKATDAPRLAEAIDASLDHLRPWMSWVRQEPEPLDNKEARLRRFRQRFEAGEDFAYALFDPDERQVLGGAGLHMRIGAGASEIGYWVHVAHVGLGLATEASAALTRVGFGQLGLRSIEIHCDPANTASVGVPRRLGFAHQVTIPGCVTTRTMTPCDMMIWTMRRKEFAASPAAELDIETFNDDGTPLPCPAACDA